MPNLKPGRTGTLIYLDASPAIDTVPERIGKAGGSVELGKTLVSEAIGHIGIFIDTEGNRVGVHATE